MQNEIHKSYPVLKAAIPTIAAITTLIATQTAWAWTPGVSNPTAASGFVVNTASRNDVLSFYQVAYKASNGYGQNMAWNGDVDTGVPGTTSSQFKTDVLRRINFYRALAGQPADISLDPVKNAKCQEAALMFARNTNISHTPPTTWIHYTANASQAAGASNIGIGSYGPEAVDNYMYDTGSGNEPVGHRRWLQYSRAQFMGTGDVPETEAYYSATAIWVVGDFKATPTAKAQSWPNAGYSPVNLAPQRWSFSYPGANFSAATVTMTKSGISIPSSIVSRANGAGDNTIVWVPTLTPTNQDATYQVTVAGVSGTGIPTSHTYAVTLFDPENLGESVTIQGSNAPLTSGENYTFNAISGADTYRLNVSSASTAAWVEGAEDPGTYVESPITYALRQTTVKRSGNKGFHLTLPTFNDQSFTVTKPVIASATSQLEFYERARFGTSTTTLHAEVSGDDGGTWTELWSRVGGGMSSGTWDANFNKQTFSLAGYAGKSIQVRFTIKYNGQSAVIGTNTNNGFFIDDITVTNSTQLVNPTQTSLAGNTSQFTLNGTTVTGGLVAGSTYYLQIQPQVGTKWFGAGPAKIVTAQNATGYAAWISQYPQITGTPTQDHDSDGTANLMEYAFGTNPTIPNQTGIPQPVRVGDTLQIAFTPPVGVSNLSYAGEWSNDISTWQTIPNTGSVGQYLFSINTIGKPQVFFRHKVIQLP